MKNRKLNSDDQIMQSREVPRPTHCFEDNVTWGKRDE